MSVQGRHTSKALPYVVGLFLVFAATSGAFATGRTEQETPATGVEAAAAYRSDFDNIVRTVREHFYDTSMNGVDWTRIAADYRAKLPAVTSKNEFESLVNQMLSELHASHTAYVTSDDVEYYMLPAVLQQDMTGHQTEHIGIMGRQERDEYVVAGILEGGPAAVSGLQSGDRLVLADGQPFRSAGSFRGKAGMPVSVQYRRGNDPTLRTVSVVPLRQNILRAFLQATDKSARVITVGGKRIGYIHLWTMANDAFRASLDRIVERQLHDTDGLILDLRDGYGGSPWSYADVFFRPDVQWQQQSRSYGALTRHSGYGKPLEVVINQGTRSAKEFFSYELKSSHRARLVGTTTAGAFLGAGGFEIGSSGLVELPILDLKIEGKRLEGKGVSPDLEVAPAQNYTDRDAQLLAAETDLIKVIEGARRRTEAL